LVYFRHEEKRQILLNGCYEQAPTFLAAGLQTEKDTVRDSLDKMVFDECGGLKEKMHHNPVNN
jgi:hypothetical protein